MPDLSGKAALVTGAAQGIGFGIALELARSGCKVVIADRNSEKAVAAAADLKADGFDAIGLALDVADDATVAQCVGDAIAHFSKIDILVNNAGIHSETLGMLSTVDDFEKCMDINLIGVWRMTQALAPHFRDIGGGKIVNIASVNGRKPWVATPAYSASKAAVINLTQSLAVTLGSDNINVNAVCPGSVLTPMADMIKEDHQLWLQRMIALRPIKRELTPQDIGRAVLFFASPLADMITGQSLNVDGGVLMT